MMIEPRIPKYQWGQRVKALIDLFNDGSFPNTPAEEAGGGQVRFQDQSLESRPR